MGIIEIPEGLQTKLCVLGDNVLKDVPKNVKALWPGKTAIIVADENTWQAAGEQVAKLLDEAGIKQAKPKIYPNEPALHADYKYIPELREIVRGKAPIAVGSGTINDLVKLSSDEAKCGGYLCVATAASVDGYTSYGAAVVVDGFKKTLPCAAPLAIIADVSVVATAPFEMTASGYADLAAKIPGGADWLIADALGEHPRDERAWGMVQTNLKAWLDDPQGLKAGKPEPLQDLFNGLAATGFAMQYYHDSRPASGAEHLCSHAWEMFDLKHNGVNPSHGFKVAVGTLITTALMTEMFKYSAAEIRKKTEALPGLTSEQRKQQVASQLEGTEFYGPALEISLAKLLEGPKLAARRQEAYEKWDLMAQRVKNQLIPFDDLKARFKLLGCPVNPPDIGSDRTATKNAILVAGMIRKRYTCIDLLAELGILEETIDTVLEKYFQF
ncbi:MAG: sn-glycerol-1-phosphate dehydrogenase [Lentisphaerae bacterium]|jgi:glycerol-1-phosphate dehydrogenase [NAD(P)+]|nr:sn-glycerol-1-phosphate dehydrogenase [Lentisphaerota bacterium]